ncbi:MAG: hypothetical protein ACXVCD_19355 [Pseudobdellovibrionaceae bacterium]
MKENDADINIGVRALNEVEALNSCISKYFKGKSESSSFKRDESLILSALDIYFNGPRISMSGNPVE